MAICPNCGKEFASKIALRDHVADKHKAKGAGKRSKPSGSHLVNRGSGPSVVNTGRMRLEEFWGRCKVGLSCIPMSAGITQLPKLDQMALMYQEYRVVAWRVRFTVRVGSTVSGMYLAAPSYVYGEGTATMQDVAALSPKLHRAIWQEGELVVPVSAVMKQKWLVTYGMDASDPADMYAGKVCVWVDGGSDAAVDAWVSYDVEFQGTTNRDRRDKIIQYKASTKTWTEDGSLISSFPTYQGTWSIDLESASKVWGSLTGLFQNWNLVDDATASALWYGHALVAGIVGGTLPVLQQDLIMHMHRSPFRVPLPGSLTRSVGGDQEVEAEVKTGQEHDQPSGEGDSSSQAAELNA